MVRLMKIVRGSDWLLIVKLFLLISLSFGLYSCEEKVEEMPENIIGKPDFARLISEMQLVESVKKSRPAREALKRKEILSMYKAVLINHKTDVDEFLESYDYYSHHPDKLEEVYQLSIEYLTAKKDSILQVTNRN